MSKFYQKPSENQVNSVLINTLDNNIPILGTVPQKERLNNTKELRHTIVSQLIYNEYSYLSSQILNKYVSKYTLYKVMREVKEQNPGCTVVYLYSKDPKCMNRNMTDGILIFYMDIEKFKKLTAKTKYKNHVPMHQDNEGRYYLHVYNKSAFIHAILMGNCEKKLTYGHKFITESDRSRNLYIDILRQFNKVACKNRARNELIENNNRLDRDSFDKEFTRYEEKHIDIEFEEDVSNTVANCSAANRHSVMASKIITTNDLNKDSFIKINKNKYINPLQQNALNLENEFRFNTELRNSFDALIESSKHFAQILNLARLLKRGKRYMNERFNHIMDLYLKGKFDLEDPMLELLSRNKTLFESLILKCVDTVITLFKDGKWRSKIQKRYEGFKLLDEINKEKDIVKNEAKRERAKHFARLEYLKTQANNRKIAKMKKNKPRIEKYVGNNFDKRLEPT